MRSQTASETAWRWRLAPSIAHEHPPRFFGLPLIVHTTESAPCSGARGELTLATGQTAGGLALQAASSAIEQTLYSGDLRHRVGRRNGEVVDVTGPGEVEVAEDHPRRDPFRDACPRHHFPPPRSRAHRLVIPQAQAMGVLRMDLQQRRLPSGSCRFASVRTFSTPVVCRVTPIAQMTAIGLCAASNSAARIRSASGTPVIDATVSGG